MNRINSIFYIAIVALFISCEKEIPFDGEIKEPKLVINSLFNDQDSFTIQVSRSLPVIDKAELKLISEANLQLFNENNELIGKLTETTTGVYHLPGFLPEAQKSYTIKASHERYDAVQATDKLPAQPVIVKVDTVLIPSTNEWDSKFRIEVTIDDPSETSNYYMVQLMKAEAKWETVDTTDYYWRPIYLTTNDPFTANFNSSDNVQGEKLLFQDAGFNGKKHTYGFSTEYYNVLNRWQEPGFPTAIQLRVYAISEAVFRYFESASRYESAKYDPFATPVQVYSNVEGGFGIFGGASSTVAIIKE
ncbi:MAG: DUF4249 domain-containing protein [Bacteroidetes bacterium]|nr:DUF4249 domain-containing protein [Bacteroidota bacterium]